MTERTLPAERGQRSANLGGLRAAGALWTMAGLSCAGLLLFVFVRENLLLESLGLSALFLGGAVAGLLTGGMLIARPGPGVARWSTVVGVGWVLAFGSLIVKGFGDPDPDPLLSLAVIIGFGVAGAVVTYWSGRPERRVERD